MHGKNYLKILAMALGIAFAFTSSFAQATGPSYSDSWTAAPGFVPQMPFATISENENVNIYNGNLTVIYPIGPAIPVGPELSFQARLRYVGPGSGGVLVSKLENNSNYSAWTNYSNNAGGWTLFMGAIITVPKYSSNQNPYCSGCEVKYIDADGTEHTVYKNDDQWNAGFTLDGSNLHIRFQSNPADQKWIMQAPDGKILEFKKKVIPQGALFCDNCIVPGDRQSWWFLTKVSDRFGNSYIVDYYDDGTSNIEKIYDERDSSRVINLLYGQDQNMPPYLPNQLLTISVPTVGSSSPGATYTLHYDAQYGQNGVNVPLLTKIDFPKAKNSDTNNLSLQFEYYQRNLLGCGEGFCEKATALMKIVYPTGGYTIYDYSPYFYEFSWVTKPPKFDPRGSTITNDISGFGVTKVTKYDGTNTTERLLERYERPENECSPFASIQETLPDGQRILHLCERKLGNELVNLYFGSESGFEWEKALRYAYRVYSPIYDTTCSFGGSGGESIPVRVIENTWKRMKLVEFRNMAVSPPSYYETGNWKIVKTEAKDLDSIGGIKTSSITENLLWDNYGHFMLTRQYDGLDPAKPNKVVLRQYMPHRGI